MSKVYFHTQTRTAELSGAERGWLRHIAESTARSWWGLDDLDPTDRLLDITGMITPGSNAQHVIDAELVRDGQRDHTTIRATTRSLDACLRVNDVPLRVGDHTVSSKNAEMNTALAVGDDIVCLAAKIHGWCEIHPWIEEHDRAWCAGIIERAITAGVYRAGMWYTSGDGERVWADQGWADVVTLLRDTTTHPGPVVLSYSVCEGFPNPEVATTMPAWPDGVDEKWDALTPAQRDERRAARTAWYDLPDHQRWQTAMDGIRRDQPWANIGPENLKTATFGPPVTLFDLFHPDRVDRVNAAYALDAEAETAEARRDGAA